MRAALMALVAMAAGCLKPSDVGCKDGRTCPAGTTCDDERSLCLTEAQTTACGNIANGKPCDAAGTPGICDRGFCEPGCGDGHTDGVESGLGDEECDDGNFASHDGCSSRCLVEVPTWTQVLPRWRGVTQHTAAYHAGLQRIVMFGGVSNDGVRDETWQQDPTKMLEPSGGWRDVSAAFGPGDHPDARYGAAMAYDSVRDVVVLFGGATFNANGKYLSDTWEYSASADTLDGERVGHWTKSTSTTTPGELFGSSMAFDPALGKIVLVGGLSLSSSTFSTATWVYDGTWSQLAVTGTPPNPGYRAAMAYDSNRNVMVLVGGSLGSSASPVTEELSGTAWSVVASMPSGGRRRSAAMTFDPVSKKMVLFGGQLGTAIAGDTWTYDGAWQVDSLPVDPPARRSGVLVADPINNVLALVGGSVQDVEDPFDDVWHFDSTTPAAVWTDASPRFGPPSPRGSTSTEVLTADGTSEVMIDSGGIISGNFASETWRYVASGWEDLPASPVIRNDHNLVYDPDRDRVLLFGGNCGGGNPDDCDPLMTGNPAILGANVWALDRANLTWSNIGVLPADAQRFRACAVFDRTAHRVVLFGGISITPDGVTELPKTDTWTFDGSTWTQLTTAEHPPVTKVPACAWDSARGALFAFDSAGGTWQLQSQTWSEVIPPGIDTPPAREYGAMAYNPWRKKLVLAGGLTSAGDILGDVWELDPATLQWTELHISGTSPLPRADHELDMHVGSRAMILFGGQSGTVFGHDDTWKLEYKSQTRDEDCTDPADNDGDAQTDDEDPDCLPAPP